MEYCKWFDYTFTNLIAVHVELNRSKTAIDAVRAQLICQFTARIVV